MSSFKVLPAPAFRSFSVPFTQLTTICKFPIYNITISINNLLLTPRFPSFSLHFTKTHNHLQILALQFIIYNLLQDFYLSNSLSLAHNIFTIYNITIDNLLLSAGFLSFSVPFTQLTTNLQFTTLQQLINCHQQQSFYLFQTLLLDSHDPM